MTLNDLRANTANVLSIAQTAQVLADLAGDELDERTVRKACEDGQLTCIRVGRRILIPRLPLIALLEGTQRQSETGPASPVTATTNPPVTTRSHP